MTPGYLKLILHPGGAEGLPFVGQGAFPQILAILRRGPRSGRPLLLNITPTPASVR